MGSVFTIFVLLLAVAGSAVVQRFVPWRAPMPLFQIAVGAFLALPLFDLRIGLNPELFLLLIISPLLFADASRISKRDFLRDLRPIGLMALSLVIATVIGVGYFIAWLIEVPLPVAMALAAIVSPTDAVAVKAMTARAPMPRPAARLLEGEGLLNDASGLVAFKFAIGTAISGTFSVWEASFTLVLVALGGVCVGALVGYAVSVARGLIERWKIEEPAITVAILLLTPFAAYLIAERVHASGILASVSAGLVSSALESRGHSSTADRLLGRSVWAMLEFVFNGVSFVLLGLQLPEIISRLDAQVGLGTLAWLDAWLAVLAVGAMLFAVRFTWCAIHLKWRVFREAAGIHDELLSPLKVGARWRRGAIPLPQLALDLPRVRVLTARYLTVLTLSGVRGSVTLAAALSLPLTLGSAPFVARDLLLFIAAGVILTSLLAGTLLLPRAVAGLPLEDLSDLEGRRSAARAAVAEAAAKRIGVRAGELAVGRSEAERRVLDEVAHYLTAVYRNRQAAESEDLDAKKLPNLFKKFGQDLRLAAVRAERETLRRLRREGLIDEDLMRDLMVDVDLIETWAQGGLASPHSGA